MEVFKKEELKYVEGLIPEINKIKDPDLREKVLKAWLIAWHKGNFKKLEDLPYGFGGVTLIQHTRAVTKISIDSSKTLHELHGLVFNMDYLIAAALLHDIDKYITEKMDEKGKLVRDTKFPHGYLQAKIAQDLSIPDEIAHAVLVHSRQRFTVNRPETIEAMMVQDADILAMNALIINTGGKLHY